MKILVLTSELTVHNGWGRYSLDLARALKREGIEMHAVVSKSGRDETSNATRMLPAFLDYARNFFLAPWYAWRLRSAARSCDAIHSFVEPYSYIAYWLSRFSGKPYYVTVHGTYGVLPFSYPLYRAWHRTSLKGARTIICVSAYTKRMLERFSLKNLSVINNGIQFDAFYAPPAALSERQHVLSVGALKRRKGQHISLEAFLRIAAQHPQTHYYLVGEQGDKGYVARLRTLVEGAPAADRVHFLSNVSDEELRSLYARARVLALTSISEPHSFEGFGLVFLEANAAGIPVIGSKESGAEDAITQGKTGYLVPQEDVEATAQALSALLTDTAAWERMSGEAVSWARAHDWSAIAPQYVRIYG